MKSNIFRVIVLLATLNNRFVDSRGIRWKKLSDQLPDYEASGDYFEVTVSHFEAESLWETTPKTASESDEISSDDGVTCSQSNFTSVLAGYELQNHVLIIFKVNVSASERELVLFLNLARRFDIPKMFEDQRFIVITSDNSSETVMEFIEKEGFPPDIVVIDEDEYTDFGFAVEIDELHAYIVDQCGKLAYIVVPPWSSAQHPYVKAAIISTIMDLPCGCLSNEFASNLGVIDTQSESEFEDYETSSDISTYSSPQTSSTLEENFPVIDIDTDDVENIEDLLDNSNTLNHSHFENGYYEIPLRIIIPSIHMHFDNKSQMYWKYDQIVLKTDNQSYHDHLQRGEQLIEISKTKWNLSNITSIDERIFVGNRSFNEIQSLAKSDKIFVSRQGKSFIIDKELVDGEKMYELSPIEFDVTKVSPVQKIFGVRHHYEQLNRWLLYKI